MFGDVKLFANESEYFSLQSQGQNREETASMHAAILKLCPLITQSHTKKFAFFIYY